MSQSFKGGKEKWECLDFHILRCRSQFSNPNFGYISRRKCHHEQIQRLRNSIYISTLSKSKFQNSEENEWTFKKKKNEGKPCLFRVITTLLLFSLYLLEYPLQLQNILLSMSRLWLTQQQVIIQILENYFFKKIYIFFGSSSFDLIPKRKKKKNWKLLSRFCSFIMI